MFIIYVIIADNLMSCINYKDKVEKMTYLTYCFVNIIWGWSFTPSVILYCSKHAPALTLVLAYN